MHHVHVADESIVKDSTDREWRTESNWFSEHMCQRGSETAWASWPGISATMLNFNSLRKRSVWSSASSYVYMCKTFSIQIKILDIVLLQPGDTIRISVNMDAIRNKDQHKPHHLVRMKFLSDWAIWAQNLPSDVFTWSIFILTWLLFQLCPHQHSSSLNNQRPLRLCSN